jgi:hypothetical protein
VGGYQPTRSTTGRCQWPSTCCSKGRPRVRTVALPSTPRPGRHATTNATSRHYYRAQPPAQLAGASVISGSARCGRSRLRVAAWNSGGFSGALAVCNGPNGAVGDGLHHRSLAGRRSDLAVACFTGAAPRSSQLGFTPLLVSARENAPSVEADNSTGRSVICEVEDAVDVFAFGTRIARPSADETYISCHVTHRALLNRSALPNLSAHKSLRCCLCCQQCPRWVP